MRLFEINSRLSKNLRGIIPQKLSLFITDVDLLEIYRILRNGHSMDGVRNIPPRNHAVTIEDISTALDTLQSEVQSGTLSIYRSIQVDDPEYWVDNQLSKSTSLGIYWSFTEEYVIQHEYSERVLFYAQVEPSSVDWIKTTILTIDGVEQECRLHPGSPIKLVYSEPEGQNNTIMHTA